MISATCALLLVANAGCAPPATSSIDIATTTSVQNSGLLDALLPAYRAATGVEVRVHAAGSGRALTMLADGVAQLVISHAPQTEAAALQAHPDWVSRRLAHNWFVLVGPKSDPAGVSAAASAVDALQRIARSSTAFISRGDGSGTEEREIALWKAAGVKPLPPQYITSGRGMAMALRHADELRGYTLSDEATFRQLAPQIDLEILYRGDPGLLNVYSVIHPRDAAAAVRLADWLVAGEGRDLIGRFTIAGKPAFEITP